MLDEEFFCDLANEDFNHKSLDCRKLWNNNVTLGLPRSGWALEGKAFVPVAREALSPEGQGTSSKDDGGGCLGRYLQEQLSTATLAVDLLGRCLASLDDGTPPERECTKNQIVQVDRQQIKQGLRLAISAISNVLLYALKSQCQVPLVD